METSWRIVGPNRRIWSFHVWSYCMLPGCNMQHYMSMRFSRSWPIIFFGPPAKAAATLHAEGLDYFFFSSQLSRITDPLPRAPLFSPDLIDRYLAIRWTDGTSYLLTWPGPETRPIDRSFLEAYRKQVEQSPICRDFPIAMWKTIADRIDDQEGQPLRPFELPWCKSSSSC